MGRLRSCHRELSLPALMREPDAIPLVPRLDKPVCSLFARVLCLSIDKTVLNEARDGAGPRTFNG